MLYVYTYDSINDVYRVLVYRTQEDLMSSKLEYAAVGGINS